MCIHCGGQRSRRVRPPVSTSVPRTMKEKIEAGYIRLEYIGNNTSRLTFTGGEGRRYRVGGDSYHRFVWIHPDDLKKMLRYPYLRMAAVTTPKSVLEIAANPKRPPRVAPQVPVAAPPMPEAKLDKGNGGLPHASEMKVERILSLNVPLDQWQVLFAQEQESDRPRKTVLRHAARRIRVAEASV